jgi:peptidoglycan/LPS O-acetylase OafA/YrhL
MLTVLAVGLFIVPGHRREQLGTEIISATLYASNYQFAAKAVDYYRFDDPPSP